MRLPNKSSLLIFCLSWSFFRSSFVLGLLSWFLSPLYNLLKLLTFIGRMFQVLPVLQILSLRNDSGRFNNRSQTNLKLSEVQLYDYDRDITLGFICFPNTRLLRPLHSRFAGPTVHNCYCNWQLAFNINSCCLRPLRLCLTLGPIACGANRIGWTARQFH